MIQIQFQIRAESEVVEVAKKCELQEHELKTIKAEVNKLKNVIMAAPVISSAKNDCPKIDTSATKAYTSAI